MQPENILPEIKFGKLDAAKLGTDIADVIRSSIEKLVEGAQSDLAAFANKMASDAIRVMALDDPEKRESLLLALVRSVELIGEIHRLRAVQTAWDTVKAIVATVVRTAIKLLAP